MRVWLSFKVDSTKDFTQIVSLKMCFLQFKEQLLSRTLFSAPLWATKAFLKNQKKIFYSFIFSRTKIVLVWLEVIYSGTSLKRTLTGQKFLFALERCPPWRGLDWKVPKFKVQLFYTGPTLPRTPPPPYLTMGMWNGEKESNFFVMCQFILHQRLK